MTANAGAPARKKWPPAARDRAVASTGSITADKAPHWSGGHGLSAYEQKMQQSPGLGVILLPHSGQSRATWHWFVGISRLYDSPQCGQVRNAVVSTMSHLLSQLPFPAQNDFPRNVLLPPVTLSDLGCYVRASRPEPHLAPINITLGGSIIVLPWLLREILSTTSI